MYVDPNDALGPSPRESINASSSSTSFLSRFLPFLAAAAGISTLACGFGSDGSTTSTTRLLDALGAGASAVSSSAGLNDAATLFFFFFFFASPSGAAEDATFELDAAAEDPFECDAPAADLDFDLDGEAAEAAGGVIFVLAGFAKMSSMDDAAALASLAGVEADEPAVVDLDFDLAMMSDGSQKRQGVYDEYS